MIILILIAVPWIPIFFPIVTSSHHSRCTASLQEKYSNNDRKESYLVWRETHN